MYAEVQLSEDTTTQYVRWEVRFEPGEVRRLQALGGSLTLVVEACDYVDAGGTLHERADVEVAIFPHAGRRNFGQAKFRGFESRRRFVENLQAGVTVDAGTFAYDAEPGSVPPEGKVIRRADRPTDASTSHGA